MKKENLIKLMSVIVIILVGMFFIKVFVDNKIDYIDRDTNKKIEKIYEIQAERDLELGVEAQAEIVICLSVSKIEDLIHFDFKKIIFIYNKDGKEIFVQVDNWLSNRNFLKYEIRFFDESRDVIIYH